MVEWQPLDSFKSIADVNLWGMILVTQTFLPLVKKARGRVINMGSILGEASVALLTHNKFTSHFSYSSNQVYKWVLLSCDAKEVIILLVENSRNEVKGTLSLRYLKGPFEISPRNPTKTDRVFLL